MNTAILHTGILEKRTEPILVPDRPHAIWFPGLNGLRFLAASLVVIMHIHNNMGISHLPQLPAFPILFKGLTAVSFFFVLSGFLITFLLLIERKKTNTVDIREFYLRRVFRIWPLYFIVIAMGTFFYWKLVPALHLPFENDYPHSLAIALYLFFLANLMNSMYHVGGMLHITWSIAVEEQFYLFWAPLVKRFGNKLPLVITLVSSASLLLNMLNNMNVFPVSAGIRDFIKTLQFHYMGFGAGFAWLLYNRKDWLLNLPVFKYRFFSWACGLSLIAYFLLYRKSPAGELISPVPLALLFGWLIIMLSVKKNTVISLENKPMNYLGKISYGIYMFHMPFVYATSFIFRKYSVLSEGPWYFPLFFLTVFTGAICMASLSYFYLEQPILRKSRVFYKPLTQ
jgi:peptidoglycan/LPS O-acetylase OafA/YrhL